MRDQDESNIASEKQHAEVTVTATTWQGRSVVVEVQSGIAVPALRKQLACPLGVELDRLRLVVGSDILEDNDKVTTDIDVTVCLGEPQQVIVALKQLGSNNADARQQGAYALGRLGNVASPEVVVPALEGALQDENVPVAVESAIALSKLGDAAGAAAQSLLAFLEPQTQPANQDGTTNVDASPLLPLPGTCARDVLFNDTVVDGIGRRRRRETVPTTAANLNSKRKAGLHALVSIGGTAVPVLLQALRDNSAKMLHADIARAIGWIGDKAAIAIPELELALDDDRDDVRLSASAAIAQMGKVAARALEKMVGHPQKNIRRSAAAALVGIEDEALPALRRVAWDGHLEARLLATTSLGQLGNPALTTLEKLATGADTVEQRSAAVQALGQIGDTGATRVLREVLLSEDWGTTVAVTTAFGAMGDSGLALLEEALAVDYWAVQEQVLEVLFSIGDAAVPLLTTMLLKSDSHVCMKAAFALGKLGVAAAPAASSLAQLTCRGHPGCLRMCCLRVLGEIGNAAVDAVPIMEDILLHDDQAEDLRCEAARVLGNVGELAVPTLSRALERGDSTALRLALAALGSIGGVAIPALTFALEDRNPCTRQYATVALGAAGIDATPSICPLAQLLTDSEVWVRYEAAEALGTIASACDFDCDNKLLAEKKLVVSELVRALGDTNSWVRTAAACALGKFGAAAESAIEALRFTSEDADAELRVASGKALQRIAWSVRKHSRRYVCRVVVGIAGRSHIYVARRVTAIAAHLQKARRLGKEIHC